MPQHLTMYCCEPYVEALAKLAGMRDRLLNRFGVSVAPGGCMPKMLCSSLLLASIRQHSDQRRLPASPVVPQAAVCVVPQAALGWCTSWYGGGWKWLVPASWPCLLQSPGMSLKYRTGALPALARRPCISICLADLVLSISSVAVFHVQHEEREIGCLMPVSASCCSVKTLAESRVKAVATLKDHYAFAASS